MLVRFWCEVPGNDAFEIVFEVLSIPIRRNKIDTGNFVQSKRCTDVIGNKEALPLLFKSSKQVKLWLDSQYGKEGYSLLK